MLGARYRTIDPKRPGPRCKDREAYAGWILADLFARAQAFRLALETIEQSQMDEAEQVLLLLGRVLSIDLAEAEARARDADLLDENTPLMLRDGTEEAAASDRFLEQRVRAMPPAFTAKFDDCRQLVRELEVAGVDQGCVGHLLRAVEFAEASLQLVVSEGLGAPDSAS